ncbi:MFS general substrate transporter [Cyathus striatus]|nr:MFS general substrate transporter [Cyathus striatus]
MNTSIAVVSSSSVAATDRVVACENAVNLAEVDEKTEATVVEVFELDLEHYPVSDDPRKWSRLRKNTCLFLISCAAMIAQLAANILNPAIEEIKHDLNATSAQLSLSISLFLLLQGLVPLIWSVISEFQGRRFVYLITLAIFTVGSIIVALSKSMKLIIAFCCFQAVGSSAVSSLGSATLADIFDPVERGSKMGIYYTAPLLGPALGPVFGGILTSALGWRSIYWFLSILGGISVFAFVLLFRDTFRKERSLVYRDVVTKRLSQISGNIDSAKQITEKESIEQAGGVEKKTTPSTFVDVKLSFRDMDPIKPIFRVLKQRHNIVILFASGLLAAFGYLATYTSSRTLGSKFDLGPLYIGLVNISYGVGCVISSLTSGWWSDLELKRIRELNGEMYAEMRLRTSVIGGTFLPAFILGLGWVSEEEVNVAAIAVMLFACGFFTTWMYTSILAYIVDANIGCSSGATATNSAFRGLLSFVALETAVPLQDGLGDGITYSIWAGLMVVCELLILLVYLKGRGWRIPAEPVAKGNDVEERCYT